MTRTIINELDLAALTHDLPEHGLLRGDIGTVVMVYHDGEAYEVEFVAADGRTVALETLMADEVEPVSGDQILHARELGDALSAKERS